MTTPAKNRDLHGNVPDRSRVALLLIDFINDFEFEDAEPLFRNTLAIVKSVAALRRRAKALDVPVIYVNDNFGKWRSDFRAQLAHSLSPGRRGRRIVQALKPDNRDYFVLKPKYSGFHSTTLDVLLDYLGTKTLILTGIAGEACVQFTANDAFLRDMNLFVPRDCTASRTKQANAAALRQMKTLLKADTRASTRIDLEALRGRSSRA